jgi:hypothetical protein
MNLVSSNIEVVINFVALHIDYLVNDMFDAWVVAEIETIGSCYNYIKKFIYLFLCYFA